MSNIEVLLHIHNGIPTVGEVRAFTSLLAGMDDDDNLHVALGPDGTTFGALGAWVDSNRLATGGATDDGS